MESEGEAIIVEPVPETGSLQTEGNEKNSYGTYQSFPSTHTPKPEHESKPATVFSSSVNLLNTIIGAGILATPYAMAHLGIVLGPIILLAVAGLMFYTQLVLVKVGMRIERQLKGTSGESTSTEVKSDQSLKDISIPASDSTSLLRDSKKEVHLTFSFITRRVLPWSEHILNIGTFLFSFGACVSYLLVISSTMPIVLRQIIEGGSDDASSSLIDSSSSFSFSSSAYHRKMPAILNHREFWILLFFCIIAPVTFLKHLSSLSILGYINLSSSGYLIAMVIYYFIRNYHTIISKADYDLFSFGLSDLSNIAMILFAYCCHINFYAIFDELGAKKRKKRVTKSSAIATFSAMTIYLIFGVLGALIGGRNTNANVLLSFPANDIFVLLGRLAIVLDVTCSLPVIFHPMRTCISALFDRPKIRARVSEKASHIISTVILLVAILATALVFKSLGVVLSLTGCTGGAMTSVLLPGILLYKTAHLEHGYDPNKVSKSRVIGVIIIILGLVLLIGGTIITLVFA